MYFPFFWLKQDGTEERIVAKVENDIITKIFLDSEKIWKKAEDISEVFKMPKDARLYRSFEEACTSFNLLQEKKQNG